MSQQEDFKFGVWEKCHLMFAVSLYAADIASDGYLAYSYYSEGQYVYFGFTLAFILFSPFPTIFTNARDYGWTCQSNDNLSMQMRVISFVCTVLYPLAAVPRFMQYWIYGAKFQKARDDQNNSDAKKYLDLMNEESRIITFIRLREAFLESAPQLVLHTYIIAKDDFANLGAAKLVPMFFSLVSLAWTLATSRPLLLSLDEDDDSSRIEESTWLGSGILTLAHFLIIASRCMALSAIERTDWILPVAHIFYTTIFLMAHFKTNAPVILFDEKRQSYFNNNAFKQATKYSSLILVAAISVFSYTHNKMSLSLRWYLPVCFLENAGMFTFNWLRLESDITRSHLAPWAVQVGLFAASVALFALFYRFQENINKWGNESKAYLLKQIKKFGCCCKSEPGDSAASDSNVVELQRFNDQ